MTKNERFFGGSGEVRRNHLKTHPYIIGLIFHIFQQKPLTTIADTTAPLSDVRFPSLTVCNANQVENSLAICNEYFCEIAIT